MRRRAILTAASIWLVAAATIGLIAPAASGASGTGSSLPSGFRAQSLSWTSTQHGWILGVAPCGPETCTTVIGTTNGGAKWTTLGTIAAPLTSDEKSGVTEIRFADDMHGWAFWPSLWATTDGGVTWAKQAPPGNGRQVPALAADSVQAFALVSKCKLNQPPSECPAPTLWRTTPSNGTWKKISLTLPAGLETNVAVLKVHGLVGYLVLPCECPAPGASVGLQQQPALDDVLTATTDGKHWSSRPNPCVPSNDEFLTDVAPISDTSVAILCVGNPGTGQADKRVLRSGDTGMTTKPAGNTPRAGIISQMAASRNGTLFVSSWSAPGSWIYRNSGGKTWTTPVSQNDDGVGWNDIVFLSNQIGWIVYGPAAIYPGNRVGEVMETTDGGQTWNLV